MDLHEAYIAITKKIAKGTSLERYTLRKRRLEILKKMNPAEGQKAVIAGHKIEQGVKL